MAQRSARQTALAALGLWRKEKCFADSVISGLLAKADLTLSDRAFALELFYGVLRNLTLLDFWIGCLRHSRIESNVRDVLRIGLYQLFLLKTPEHAAVHESVMLAPQKQRPVVNGVLRAATRQRSELLAGAKAQPVYVRRSHPRFLVERWQQHFGVENTEELCKWNNSPAAIYGRINRLRIDPKTFLQVYPDSRQLPDNPDFVEFNTLPAAALASGHCYIQDPSTALACQLLGPKPEEKILDACAAPGGKTSYLAQLMQNRGTIIACDRDSARLQIQKDNTVRLGTSIVRLIRHDWTREEIRLHPIRGGRKATLGDDERFSASLIEVEAGGQTEVVSSPDRAISVHIASGTGRLLLGTADELHASRPAIAGRAGDLFLIAPHAHYAFANDGAAPLVVAEHRIAPAVAFV